MLSVKQGGIKYHFLSLGYDSTWDWIPVSQTIGEHLTTKPMGWVFGLMSRVYGEEAWRQLHKNAVSNI